MSTATTTRAMQMIWLFSLEKNILDYIRAHAQSSENGERTLRQYKAKINSAKTVLTSFTRKINLEALTLPVFYQSHFKLTKMLNI